MNSLWNASNDQWLDISGPALTAPRGLQPTDLKQYRRHAFATKLWFKRTPADGDVMQTNPDVEVNLLASRLGSRASRERGLAQALFVPAAPCGSSEFRGCYP